MTPSEVIQSFIREVIDNRNLDALDGFLAPNFFYHDRPPGLPPGEAQGIAGTRRFFETQVFNGLSEFQTTFEDIFAEDDLVAVRWRQGFRHSGQFLGARPTGRRITIDGMSIARVRDDKIVEEWETRDTVRMLAEIGVIRGRPELEPENLGLTVERPSVQPVAPGGANTDVVRRFMFDALGGGRPALADTLFARNFANRLPLPGQQPGLIGEKQFLQRFRTGFPDASVSLDVSVTEGDKVASRWSARGTHEGTIFGAAPTGRRVNLTGIDFVRVAGGQIVERWSQPEWSLLMQQIGAIQGI